MSERFDTEWAKGETWTLPVRCRNAAGTDLATIAAAEFLMRDMDGNTTFQITGGAMQTIQAPLVTHSIPAASQANVARGVHRIELFVTDGSGAISRQLHGTVLIV